MMLRRVSAVVVVLAGACTGTEIGNPARDDSDLTLAVVVSGEGVALSNADATDARTIVDTAWVAMGDIRFVYDDDCSRDMDSRATVPGPVVVDLVTGPMLPAELPRDVDYCRVRIPLTRADGSLEDVPAELVDHSVLLEGTFDGTPFMVRTRGRPELELRSMDEPFRIDGEVGAVVLAFDVSAWLEGIDLGSAAAGDDGRIVIDEDNERGQLNLFDDNLRSALTLYRDVDADGELDADELAAPIAGGGP